MTDFIDNLTSAFNTVEGCLETESTNFFWISENKNNGRSIIIKDPCVAGDLMMKIHNIDKKNINFLCIDSCVFSSDDGSRCDYAVFDDEKFCFCELKFEIIKWSSASQNLRKARNVQLSETIAIFKEKVDFSSFTAIEAYVGLKKEFYPRKPARLSDLKLEFWDKHKVEYFEQNEITFQKKN